ncbi:MAG: squalene synthase HpnC [Mariprofundaceae bacterium]|nr:squalene synthase HpnC [Mariprofundaceae bacterium]
MTELQPAKPNLQVAYDYCQHLASQHYENFPTASKLIHARLRPAVAAIYAFARTADDIADEGSDSAEERLQALDAWESLIDTCPQGFEQQCIHLALNDAIQRFQLPEQALRDLLTAFRMDCRIQSYAVEDELMQYCHYSANPVGRLMLALYGIRDSQAMQASDAICTALQLTNFWQDFSIDHPKGRCYLPESWLQAQKLTASQLTQGDVGMEQARDSIQHAFDVTESLFIQGRTLFPMLPFRLRLQIIATWHGGMHILTASKKLNNPLKTRPKLHKKDWLFMVPKILWDTLFPPKVGQ